MSQVSILFQSLVSVAVVSMIVLGVGALITRQLRQPIERVRCIQWTLVALIVALFVRQASVLPSLSLKIFPAESVAATAPDSFNRLPTAEVRAIRNTMSDAPFAANTEAAEVVTANTAAMPAEKEAMRRLSWNDAWIAIQLTCLIVAAVGALYCVVQLFVGHWQLRNLLAHSEPASESLLSNWRGYPEAISESTRVFVSQKAAVPMTFGVRRPVIILPRTLVESSDIQTITYCLSH